MAATKAFQAWCLLCTAALTVPAAASGLRVTPLRIDLSATQTANQVELANFGPNPLAVQVSVHDWSQSDGRDVYSPTKDIFFAPPIVSVPAGRTTVVRFRLRAGAAKDVERTYRVYFQETAAPQAGGMSFRLKLGVPVFVSPLKPAAPGLSIANAGTGPDGLRLSLANEGKAHLKILGLELYPATTDRAAPRGALAQATHSQKGANYLLPGTRHDWSLKVPAGADLSRHVLLVRTDDYTGKSAPGMDARGWLWQNIPGTAAPKSP